MLKENSNRALLNWDVARQIYLQKLKNILIGYYWFSYEVIADERILMVYWMDADGLQGPSEITASPEEMGAHEYSAALYNINKGEPEKVSNKLLAMIQSGCVPDTKYCSDCYDIRWEDMLEEISNSVPVITWDRLSSEELQKWSSRLDLSMTGKQSEERELSKYWA